MGEIISHFSIIEKKKRVWLWAPEKERGDNYQWDGKSSGEFPH